MPESGSKSGVYFRHKLRVAYHETDAMAVVHHSNHIKYFEEARVEYLRQKKMLWHDRPEGKIVFAVRALDVKYLKTARFDEELEVWTQGRLAGARIYFRYALYSSLYKYFVALGSTELIALGSDNKPMRMPKDLIQAFESESWDDNWPPQ